MIYIELNIFYFIFFILGENEVELYHQMLGSNGQEGDTDEYSYNNYNRSKYNYNDGQCYSFCQQLWDYLVNEKKVKLNIIDKFGDTPLSLAVKLNRRKVILQLVLNNSVQIELTNCNNPPFHIYCEEGVLDPNIFFPFFLRLYVIKGCTKTNFEGKTPLHCLLNNSLGQENPYSLIKYITKFQEIPKIFEIQDSLGQTPLMTAICHSYPYPILKLLFPPYESLKYSLNCKNNNGFNALALALVRYQGGFLNSHPVDSFNWNSYSTSSTPATTPPRNGGKTNCSKSENNLNEFIDGEHSLHLLIDDLSKRVTLDQTIPKVLSVNSIDLMKNNEQQQQQQQQLANGKSGDSNETKNNSVGKSTTTTATTTALDKLKLDNEKLVVKSKSNCTLYPMHSNEVETVLSIIIRNKHISYRTINLLVRKCLVRITFGDILSCLIHFRLDLLDELIKNVPSGSNLYKEISSNQGFAINILDHVYSHRRLYLSATSNTNGTNILVNGKPYIKSKSFSNGQSVYTTAVSVATANGPSSSSSSTISTSSATTSYSITNCNTNGCEISTYNPNENCLLSQVTHELAMENLKRVEPLLIKFFDYFGHDINYVARFCNPETKKTVDKLTVIHALIQANSWLSNPTVVDYILVEKGKELNTEISLEGRGTPLNYAIRLGQFYIAEKLLDLGADVMKVDLKIPVLPLKRGFSKTIRRMVQLGARIPPEFGQQMCKIRFEDSQIENEFGRLMSEIEYNYY